MIDPARIHRGVSLKLYCTLKAGGKAERFFTAFHVDDLAEISIDSQLAGEKPLVLGWGSNILPSDKGITGLVIYNATRSLEIEGESVVVDSGLGFQDLFLQAAQVGLGGLEFAVGIPGTVGGALVSNAGAYRSNVSEFLREIEVVFEGRRQWVSPDFMQFSYRDSLLRHQDAPAVTLLRMRFELPRRNQHDIYNEARDYQRQRISKQPPSASAGSFFKNVVDAELAANIEGLTDGMRANGVVPAGFLIEACGLKGKRYGGAMIGARHANFLLNVSGATASEIRALAEYAIARVEEKFGVRLEEEALYLGDWSGWVAGGELLH